MAETPTTATPMPWPLKKSKYGHILLTVHDDPVCSLLKRPLYTLISIQWLATSKCPAMLFEEHSVVVLSWASFGSYCAQLRVVLGFSPLLFVVFNRNPVNNS